MTATYDCIATTTLGSATSTISFTSIPQTYTDLVIVAYVRGASSNSMNLRCGNNSYDSGSNYSNTNMFARTTDPTLTFRASNATRAYVNVYTNMPSAASTFGNVVIHMNNYANTTTYKTFLSRAAGVGATDYAGTEAAVVLWRNTSAINQIQFYLGEGTVNFQPDSIITLYGIKAE